MNLSQAFPIAVQCFNLAFILHGGHLTVPLNLFWLLITIAFLAMLLRFMLPVGTRSLLFGYHQVLIHPLIVATAWTKLYGFPRDLRLWVAFFVHDLGYWGKPNMDGPEGEQHVFLGARIMNRLFDRQDWEWNNFCLFHSRFYAIQAGRFPSRLCYADKLAIVICPVWLQLLLMNLSGEISEYMHLNRPGRTSGEGMTQRQWCRTMQNFLRGYLSTATAPTAAQVRSRINSALNKDTLV